MHSVIHYLPRAIYHLVFFHDPTKRLVFNDIISITVNSSVTIFQEIIHVHIKKVLIISVRGYTSQILTRAADFYFDGGG